MKIQSIFIFCVIFNTGYVENGPLTTEENLKRLETCGKVPFNLPKEYRVGWGFNESIFITATAISQRHVLTSAELCLHKQFYHGNHTLCETASNSYHPVPQKYLTFYFNWAKPCGTEKCDSEPVRPVEAYYVCNDETFKVGSSYSLPMIVEIDARLDMNWPCLPEDNILYESQQLEVFKILNSTRSFHRELITIDAFNSTLIRTNVYNGSEVDKGGALVTYSDREPITLLGIAGGGDANEAYFHNVFHIVKQICNVSGICPKPKEVSTPVPLKTEQPTESSNSTTSEFNGSSESSTSSSEFPESSTSKILIPYITPSSPTPPPGEFHWKHSDIDEEFGDFLERNEGWNDESEENNDIFLSDDFRINSGNSIWMGIELFVLGCLVLIKI